MPLISWAGAKVSAAGAFIGTPDRALAVVLISTGVYEVTLENALGVSECCPVVTPWYAPDSDLPPKVYPSAGLKGDGVTLVVNLFSVVAGVDTPTSSAFCLVVDRLS